MGQQCLSLCNTSYIVKPMKTNTLISWIEGNELDSINARPVLGTLQTILATHACYKVQLLYTYPESKAKSFIGQLRALFPNITFIAHKAELTSPHSLRQHL